MQRLTLLRLRRTEVFGKKIIKLRTEALEPAQIVKKLENKYGISAYQGDVFGYLDNAVRNLDAVELIAKVHSKKKVVEEAKKSLKRKFRVKRSKTFLQITL